MSWGWYFVIRMGDLSHLRPRILSFETTVYITTVPASIVMLHAFPDVVGSIFERLPTSDMTNIFCPDEMVPETTVFSASGQVYSSRSDARS